MDFCRGDGSVKVSYKKLWKILIDKEMMKKDLQLQAGISWTSVTKLSKGENVGILAKQCLANLKIFRLWELEESFV